MNAAARNRFVGTRQCLINWAHLLYSVTTLSSKCLASLFLLFSNYPVFATNIERRPNVVLILADDLGYGDVHCINPKRGRIPTPGFDKLAQQGMTFTDAHSGSSVCSPTRYGLLTGRYAWRTRLQRGVLDDYLPPLIAANRLTVAGMLKGNGYHTACVGKWHLGYTVDQPAKKVKGRLAGAPLGARTLDGPITRGFDHFFGFHHARMMESIFEDDRVTQLSEPIDMLPKLARHATEYIGERAKSNKPFFLYLPLSAPHSPVLPSKDWQGKSGLGAYADFVMQTDAVIGEVLAALDKAKLAENTLVIVTSDNGCAPNVTDALERKGHFPSADFRGYKSDIWEGGHRVPFFARWPGKVKAGETCASMICLTDIMATCAELLGTKLPDTAAEDSFSFLPDLLGTGKTARTNIVHHSIHGRFAIREGQSKLCLCADSGGWSKGAENGPPVQLYDLKSEIGEQLNLQSAKPDDVRRLTVLLDKIVDDGRSTPGKRQKNDVTVESRSAKTKADVKEKP